MFDIKAQPELADIEPVAKSELYPSAELRMLYAVGPVPVDLEPNETAVTAKP